MFNHVNARSSAFLLVMILASSAFAASDPSMQQIYDAASAGHLAQAQAMMDNVLRDHPNSAKAHYVQAELYAKERRVDLARQELGNAERLSPGLSFARPEAVRALREELSRTSAFPERFGSSSPQRAFPWGIALVLVAGIGGLWLLLRRRSPVSMSSQYSPDRMPMANTAPNAGAATMATPMTPGAGSGIASGLASGLAVGAGVVAGEELARHFLGSGSPSVSPGAPPPERRDDVADPNGDMGGTDFGVQDPGSWDDDAAAGGTSSDDDWT
ncbi:MAG: hypothetical protein WDO56_16915 [Gammaproteobacteria bacterium]